MTVILGISGSLRRLSHNTELLRVAAANLPDGARLEIFDLSPLPFYNADLEAEHGFPEPVQRFRDAIADADALIFACPEYNYSVTGVLKNALDWASRPVFGPPRQPAPLQHKPFGIVGAGGRFGTLRAQLHLRQIAIHSEMRGLMRPEVFVERAREKFDAEGRLTDERVRGEVRDLVYALVAFTRELACR
ncbi:MAG: NAD(P)H-dependent oxidoreductase [Chloroflexi bacterium]|nr:NAD(P)H-dependent oxidoreductase [Chloroflexota bacterium]